jgi:hypothetical protein
MMEQLRSDMEGLMAELIDLGRRNDELMTAKDADLAVIRDLDNQSKEYKRKYEQAKNELRSVKGAIHICFIECSGSDAPAVMQLLLSCSLRLPRWMTSCLWLWMVVLSTPTLLPSYQESTASSQQADQTHPHVYSCP